MECFSKVRVLLITFFTFFLTTSLFAYEPEKFDVIVDSDVAQDDWISILYVLNQKERSNLLGLSAVGSGESHCEAAKQTISKLIYLAGRENENIPVTCGDSVPMQGFHTWPDFWRSEADNISGIALPENPKSNILKTHTAEWMKETLLNNPRPVVIIALGPLTNIAQLIQKYPETKSKIKRIYSMGGAFWVPGNLRVKNFSETLQNPHAEWNIWVDPLAASIVLNSNVPFTAIPLDATNKIQVTREYADNFKENARSNVAKFYSDVLDKNLWFIDSGEYYFWDILTTASVYEPICETEDYNIGVVLKYDFYTTGQKQFENFGPTFSEAPEQFANFMQNRRAFEQIETGRTYAVKSVDKKNFSTKRPHKICVKADKNLFTKSILEVMNRD